MRKEVREDTHGVHGEGVNLELIDLGSNSSISEVKCGRGLGMTDG